LKIGQYSVKLRRTKWCQFFSHPVYRNLTDVSLCKTITVSHSRGATRERDRGRHDPHFLGWGHNMNCPPLLSPMCIVKLHLNKQRSQSSASAFLAFIRRGIGSLTRPRAHSVTRRLLQRCSGGRAESNDGHCCNEC